MALTETEKEYRLSALDRSRAEDAAYDLMDMIEDIKTYHSPTLGRQMDKALERLLDHTIYAAELVDAPEPEPPPSTATGEAIDRVRAIRKARR